MGQIRLKCRHRAKELGPNFTILRVVSCFDSKSRMGRPRQNRLEIHSCLKQTPNTRCSMPLNPRSESQATKPHIYGLYIYIYPIDHLVYFHTPYTTIYVPITVNLFYDDTTNESIQMYTTRGNTEYTPSCSPNGTSTIPCGRTI